ncbi:MULTISPECIES: DUF58 domain-containing protein [Dictyoglomus]|uniref:DUF58 domain-containing protein n=1 Tax=Dictyoglomus TaxID=13 RepID=UPI003C7623FD
MEKEKLDLEFLEKLEKLRLAVKRLRFRSHLGERKSPKMGRGTEFSDYRSYQVGDELRYLDWNIYARFEKFLVKLFEEEEDVEVHILLDASSSMDFGNPTKFFYGKKLALAFSYLSLSSWEKTTFSYFQDKIKETLPLERKKENIYRLLNLLNEIKAEGNTNISETVKKYASSLKRKGILIIISDLLSSEFEEGIIYARYKKMPVYLIHTICEEEISPFFSGNLTLIDSETGEKMDILLDEYMIQKYQKALEKFLNHIESFTMLYNVEYLRSITSIPIEDLILKYLRVGGWIK